MFKQGEITGYQLSTNPDCPDELFQEPVYHRPKYVRKALIELLMLGDMADIACAAEVSASDWRKLYHGELQATQDWWADLVRKMKESYRASREHSKKDKKSSQLSLPGIDCCIKKPARRSPKECSK